MLYRDKNKQIGQRIVVLLILVLLNNNFYSQNSFDLLVKTDINESPYNIIENHNNNFVIIGSRRGLYHYTDANALILSCNNLGNIVSQKEISVTDSIITLTHIYQKFDNNYLCFGKIKNNNNTSSSFYFCELDIDLNLIKSKKYKLPTNKGLDLQGFLINSSENIVLYGGFVEETESWFEIEYMFFEISQNLDSIKLVSQNEANFNFSPILGLIEREDIGYYAQTITYPDNKSTGSQILKLDDNFNVLSYKDIPNNIYHYGNIKWFSDTTYILTGKKTILKSGKYQNDEIACMIIDTLHNVIHQKYFGRPDISDIPAQFTSMDFLDKNNIFIVGVHDYKYEGGVPGLQNNKTYIFINQVDSTLETKKELFYGGDANYYVYSVKATSDGGCIIASTRYDFETQDYERDALILKVDANGNLPVSIEEPQIKVHEQIIYPNPGKTNLKIRTAVQCIGGQFTMYDISGKQVFQKNITQRVTQINTVHLPIGTYIYNYVFEGKEIENGKWIKNAL